MTIRIEYFSDVLCVWAYGGQIRVDELKRDFGDAVEIEYRFVPIFGAARHNVERNWRDKGGRAGFNQHLQQVVSNWEHVDVHPGVWTEVAPQTSTTAHLYLKAIQMLLQQGEISDRCVAEWRDRNAFEQALWMMREAFFLHGRNIALRSEQDAIAEQLQLPVDAIHQLIDCGEAHAGLHLDDEARHNYHIPGSPTMVLNEGRQLLYGNVGYRIIDANIRELLHNRSHGEASWC